MASKDKAKKRVPCKLRLYLIFGDNCKNKLTLSKTMNFEYKINSSDNNIKQREKTWVEFQDVNENVEKLEFPVPSNLQQHDLDIDARQSDVFIGDLKNWNLLD